MFGLLGFRALGPEQLLQKSWPSRLIKRVLLFVKAISTLKPKPEPPKPEKPKRKQK